MWPAAISFSMGAISAHRRVAWGQRGPLEFISHETRLRVWTSVHATTPRIEWSRFCRAGVASAPRCCRARPYTLRPIPSHAGRSHTDSALDTRYSPNSYRETLWTSWNVSLGLRRTVARVRWNFCCLRYLSRAWRISLRGDAHVGLKADRSISSTTRRPTRFLQAVGSVQSMAFADVNARFATLSVDLTRIPLLRPKSVRCALCAGQSVTISKGSASRGCC